MHAGGGESFSAERDVGTEEVGGRGGEKGGAAVEGGGVESGTGAEGGVVRAGDGGLEVGVWVGREVGGNGGGGGGGDGGGEEDEGEDGEVHYEEVRGLLWRW